MKLFQNYKTVGSIGLAFLLLAYFIFEHEKAKILSVSVNAWSEVHQADCAVVLTGDNARIQEGMDLLAKKYVKKTIISGVNPTSRLVEIFPQWFMYQLDQENVILEKYSRTTYGNAVQSYSLVEALNCKDIVLVTSHFHMYRALKIFKSIFKPEILIYPRAIASDQVKTSSTKLFVETVKSLFYRLWAY